MMKIALISRSFRPQSEILSSAYLEFANRVRVNAEPILIFQSFHDLGQLIKSDAKYRGIKFWHCKRFTNSASNLTFRLLESFYFTAWVIICLIISRPGKVYITTDPPILVPFVVFLYSKLFGAKYYYHLQDIHPEAANVVVPLNKFLFVFLRKLDNLTITGAEAVITISKDMSSFLKSRTHSSLPIHLLDNPAASFSAKPCSHHNGDYIFSGNFGRLQLIPLLIAAISKYLAAGGRSTFTFVGDGFFQSEIKGLAQTFDNVTYKGRVDAEVAASIASKHLWGLLPLQDDVSSFAFPSKSSSYIFSGCRVLAVCGSDTSLARWVVQHDVGVVVGPSVDQLVRSFFYLQDQPYQPLTVNAQLRRKLSIDYFVNELMEVCDVSIS